MERTESGRSMIEMLGVLAIIGVLSIGGLAGYTMAMNRYRASNLSDYASRCVVVAQTQTISGIIGTTAKNCNTYLTGESAPAWLTGTGAGVTVKDNTNGEVIVEAKGVPTAVNKVLTDRFDGKSVGGVTFSATGTTATFTFTAS